MCSSDLDAREAVDRVAPAEGEAVVMDWIGHGGQIAGDPNAIGLDV